MQQWQLLLQAGSTGDHAQYHTHHIRWKRGGDGVPNEVDQQPTNGEWDSRAEEVKQAFLDAFEGYRLFAAGYDELLPIAGGKINKYAV
jgi:hypothetical protein